MPKKLKTHEVRKILKFGEAVREHPSGLLLSIPIFAFGTLHYGLKQDRAGVGGSYGHMGIAFKNYYKHNWQQPVLLKIAYYLFDKASQNSSGEGLISTILHCGHTAKELDDFPLAENKMNQALKLAKKIGTLSQTGYILSHLGLLHVEQGKLPTAFKEISKSLIILQSAVQKQPHSFYLQIWLSNAELSMAKYYLAIQDKPLAKKFARLVQKRSQKYNLKLRQQEAQKLLTRISASIISTLPIFLKNYFSY